MKKQMMQLAMVATAFEREGNVAAGKVITKAMQQIAKGEDFDEKDIDWDLMEEDDDEPTIPEDVQEEWKDDRRRNPNINKR